MPKYKFTTEYGKLTIHTPYGDCHFEGGVYETIDENRAKRLRQSKACKEVNVDAAPAPVTTAPRPAQAPTPAAAPVVTATPAPAPAPAPKRGPKPKDHKPQ